MSDCGCNTNSAGGAFTNGACGEDTNPPASGFTVSQSDCPVGTLPAFQMPVDPCGCGTTTGNQDFSDFVRKTGPQQDVSSIINFTTSPLVPNAVDDNQAVNYGQLIDAIGGINFDGILSGLGLSIDEDDTHVIIAPGSWRLDGTVYSTTDNTPLDIDAQDPTDSIYDVVYADSSGNLNIVSGTPSLTPVQPDIPDDTIEVGTVLITPTSVTILPPSGSFVTTNTNQDHLLGTKNWSSLHTFARPPVIKNIGTGTVAFNLAVNSNGRIIQGTDQTNVLHLVAPVGVNHESVTQTPTFANGLVTTGPGASSFIGGSFFYLDSFEVYTGSTINSSTNGVTPGAHVISWSNNEGGYYGYMRDYLAIGPGNTTGAAVGVLELHGGHGFLTSQLTASTRDSISLTSNPYGLLVYQTDDVEGLWVYESTGWTRLLTDADGSSFTFQDGIVDNTGVVGLGGTFTQDIGVDTTPAFKFKLGDISGRSAYIQVDPVNFGTALYSDDGVTGIGQVYTYPGSITVEWDSYVNGQDSIITVGDSIFLGLTHSGFTQILMSITEGISIKDTISNIGMVYDDDYSSTSGSNPRWIPDVHWVNQAIASGGGGTGTVTSVSVVSANGFSGSVATSTTTPAITLTLQNATTSQSGQLTSTDWNTFNGKQASGSYAVLNGSNNFTGGFTSQYNGGSTYPFTSISNSGITNTTASGVAVTIQSNALSWITGGFVGSLVMTPTANRTVTIPDATTTLLGTNTTATVTNKDLTSGTNTFPTFNQNTTGSAAKWTTARNLAGNSVDGSANVAFANKFIVQGTTDAGLSGAQFLGSLGTGLVKNTTTTGILSIATAGTDYVAPATTVAGFALTGNISLAQLSALNSTVILSGTYDGSANRTVRLNTANANTWTAEQQIQLTTTQLSLNYDGSNTVTFTTGSSGGMVIAPSGGFVTISGGLTVSGFNTTNTSGNLFIPGTTTATSETATLWQVAGSSTNFVRTGFGGTNATQISVGSNYSAVLATSSPIQTAASGTHPWLSNLAVNPTVYTVGGATVSNTATFYLGGASTIGATNYTFYSASGLNYMGGDLQQALGSRLLMTEGTGGRVGVTTLVAGTKAITITGVTTSSRAFISLVTPSGTSLTTTYQVVCTLNTVTIQANIAAGTINASDASTLNYLLIN